jgi:hypothetical protein
MRIFFRHTVSSDDSQQLARACVQHTVALLQRTLPEQVWQACLGPEIPPPFLLSCP